MLRKDRARGRHLRRGGARRGRARPAQIDAGLRPIPAHGAADRAGRRGASASRAFTQNGAARHVDPGQQVRDVSDRRRSAIRTTSRPARRSIDAAPPAAQTPPAGRGRGRGRRRRSPNAADSSTPRSRRRAITARSTRIATSGSATRPAPNAVQITTDGSEQGAHQVRHGELGVRRGAEPAHGDVVVARRKEARVLPVRREQGPGFLPHAEPHEDPGHARRRGVSEAGRAESDRRSVRLRRGHEDDDARSTSATASRFENDVLGYYVFRVDVVARRATS